MGEQFKVGEIAILQCDPACTPSMQVRRLTGEEVQVIAPLGLYVDFDATAHGYLIYHPARGTLLAEPHELRRKRPPTTGEAKIRAMFDTPPQVERRQPVTAWQAQYDTAQALMKMGVRVKPGVWPVEVA